MDRNTFILDAPQRELFSFFFFFVCVSYHGDRSIVNPNDHMAVLVIILMDVFLILFLILLRVQGNKRWECM